MIPLGIDYTFFAVSDQPRTIAFYHDTLGRPLGRLILEDTRAEFEVDPGTLILGQGDSFRQPGGGVVAIAVQDTEFG